jgi:hypothetical protein
MTPVRGTCLCGGVAWQFSEPLDFTSHCHCSRCRKVHGAPFATYVLFPAKNFRLERGREHIVRYESSPGFFRPFCGGCGSVVSDGEAWKDLAGAPAGPLDDDPGVRPVAHIFAASKAPWFEIQDGLARFDTYPPEFDAPALAELPDRHAATGGPGGSCLCGGVAYVVEACPLRCYNCHCSRCRKARAAAYASNLIVAADGLRFTRGEDLLASYKRPDARFFTQVFCRTCGSPMPRVDRDRGFAVVPMGSLDGNAGMPPQRHIFVASKAPWYEIPDALPQDAEYPTS